MRALLRLSRDKSALSNIVAYVLLIAITVSLSVIVYSWLRFYVGEEDILACSEDVNVIIRSYQCYNPSGGVGGRLVVTLKNKGLFTVDGYRLRVHDRPDAEFGIYKFNETGSEIMPGEDRTDTYWFNDSDHGNNFKTLNKDTEFLKTVTLVDIQPFMSDDGGISCESYASQKVVCT